MSGNQFVGPFWGDAPLLWEKRVSGLWFEQQWSVLPLRQFGVLDAYSGEGRNLMLQGTNGTATMGGMALSFSWTILEEVGRTGRQQRSS